MSKQLALIENQFKPLVPRMQQIIPATANLPVERVMQSVMVACESNPKLMDCSAVSMQKAVFTACTLGLLVDGVSGQGYLVPYRNEVQFQTGFKGYGTIAARSGYTLGGDLIYEGEEYSVRIGTSGHAWVKFDPTKRFPGAKIIAAFATLESNTSPALVLAMSLDELLHIKDMSQATYATAPWKVHFGEMCIKTVKKRLGKSCPVDILQRAAALDDAVDQGHTAYLRPEDRALIVDQVAEPLSPMQPPPAQDFTLDTSVKFEVIMGDGVKRDLGSIDNWSKRIWDRLEKVNDIGALNAFTERNKETFAAVAARYPQDVNGLRMKIRERIEELKTPGVGAQTQTASTPPETQSARQSEPAPAVEAFEIVDAPGITRKFDTLDAYLKAYEITVGFLYRKGDAAGLLKFDQLNRAIIDAKPGLADAVRAIDARVRVSQPTMEV